MTTQTSFGQWLKQRRKVLDLTREDLAGRIGCAAITLTKIEADERRPSKSMAELLAQHLNIPADEHPTFVRFARAEAAKSTAPWGTPFHPPTNLPAQPTLLIGRDVDVAAIRKRLLQPESRLLTLTGPPGIGKTRLALQVAAQALDDFTDGVFFIALASVSDADLVATTIASTLGVPDVGPRTPLERLKAFLHDKLMLLVLDNFEQILAGAPQIAELLAACLSIKMLVTSRSPLRIRQERQLPVSPLALPDLAHLPDIENVAHYSAVTLFLERAQAVKPDFSLTEENAPTVAAICTRLDGLPLAIELISARVKLLSPAALLERLGGRLMLQSDGLRDIEPRHRTLNAAIDWSYQLLNADEQTLFRRLGVFVGGWAMEAAGEICMESVNLNILDGMASLLDKNLVKQSTRSDDEPRFMMLETIREYSLEKLAESGELNHLGKRHADYFTVLAEHTEIQWFQTDPARWLTILEAEHDNFRAALAWSETGLRLAVALHEFWMRRGHMREGSHWLTRALTRHELEASSEPVAAERALRARALFWLGRFSAWQGDLDTPQAHYKESLALFRELEDREGIAGTLGDLSTLFHWLGDLKQAVAFAEESLALFQELGNTNGTAWALSLLGHLSNWQGHTEQAGVLFEESVTLFRAANNPWGIASVIVHLGKVALARGDYDRANAYMTESITRLWELGDRWQIVQSLEEFAHLLAVEGQQSEDIQPRLLRSVHIFGAAEVIRKTFLSDIDHSHDGVIATLHAKLNDASFAAAWAEGRAMTLEQVVSYALDQSENESGRSM